MLPFMGNGHLTEVKARELWSSSADVSLQLARARHCHCPPTMKSWYWNNKLWTCGYGSIPLNTIFRGMNTHKSQLFWRELQGYKVLTHCHVTVQHGDISWIFFHGWSGLMGFFWVISWGINRWPTVPLDGFMVWNGIQQVISKHHGDAYIYIYT